MAKQLEWGIAIPQVFSDGPVDMGLVRKWSTLAEGLGYQSLWVQEGVLGDVAVLEPLSLLSYVSAVTDKVRLGTSVMVAPLQNPVQLAGCQLYTLMILGPEAGQLLERLRCGGKPRGPDWIMGWTGGWGLGFFQGQRGVAGRGGAKPEPLGALITAFLANEYGPPLLFMTIHQALFAEPIAK